MRLRTDTAQGSICNLQNHGEHAVATADAMTHCLTGTAVGGVRYVTDPRAGGAPTVLRMVLGKRLQDLREKAGLSYEQAGQALDVTHATIRRMEKAEVGLKIPYVEKLLHTYGVTAPE